MTALFLADFICHETQIDKVLVHGKQKPFVLSPPVQLRAYAPSQLEAEEVAGIVKAIFSLLVSGAQNKNELSLEAILWDGSHPLYEVHPLDAAYHATCSHIIEVYPKSGELKFKPQNLPGIFKLLEMNPVPELHQVGIYFQGINSYYGGNKIIVWCQSPEKQ